MNPQSHRVLQAKRHTPCRAQDLPVGNFASAATAFILFLLLVLTGARGALAKQSQGPQLPAEMEASVTAVCGKTATYDCYTNHKYGYLLAWPKTLLVAQGESDAGDGQLFNAPDGRAQLTCWGTFNNIVNQSLQQFFQEAQQESDLQVTYKHLGKDFFVLSGRKDGKIVYRKTVKGKLVQATFELTYDPSLKDAFNPIVGDLAKSFIVHPVFMAR